MPRLRGTRNSVPIGFQRDFQCSYPDNLILDPRQHHLGAFALNALADVMLRHRLSFSHESHKVIDVVLRGVWAT